MLWVRRVRSAGVHARKPRHSCAVKGVKSVKGRPFTHARACVKAMIHASAITSFADLYKERPFTLLTPFTNAEGIKVLNHVKGFAKRFAPFTTGSLLLSPAKQPVAAAPTFGHTVGRRVLPGLGNCGYAEAQYFRGSVVHGMGSQVHGVGRDSGVSARESAARPGNPAVNVGRWPVKAAA